MITKPTILVLGAGASMHLGYPSGRQLVDKIVNDRRRLIGLHQDLGRSIDEVENYIRALKYSGRASVDAFLENRPEFIDVGKLSIAQALLPFEDIDRLFLTQNNWYEYLFQNISTSISDISKNELSIITFNYDRTIETYLHIALRNSFGVTAKEANEVLRSIPIVHLHGQLGFLPWQNENCRDYESTSDVQSLSHSASMIKIIHENIDSDREFIEAEKLISQAKFIYFLGFGYHEENITRLRINWGTPGVTYQGTCYNLTNLEMSRIAGKYRNLHLPSPRYDVQTFLREVVSFT